MSFESQLEVIQSKPPLTWSPPSGWNAVRPWSSVALLSRREIRIDMRLSDKQIDQAMKCAGMPQPIRIRLANGIWAERWVCLEINQWLATMANARGFGDFADE